MSLDRVKLTKNYSLIRSVKNTAPGGQRTDEIIDVTVSSMTGL